MPFYYYYRLIKNNLYIFVHLHQFHQKYIFISYVFYFVDEVNILINYLLCKIDIDMDVHNNVDLHYKQVQVQSFINGHPFIRDHAFISTRSSQSLHVCIAKGSAP